MTEQKQIIGKMKASASLLPNNLTLSSTHLAYVHRNEIHLVPILTSNLTSEKIDAIRSAYTEKDPVAQVSYIHVTQGELLVAITLTGGIYIYDETGSKLLQTYHVDKKGPSTSYEQHLRGIAHDGKETLYVGCGTGEILIFSLANNKIALAKRVDSGHHVPIVSMDSKDGHVVSVDESGNVVFWGTSHDDLKKQKEIIGNGEPGTSVQIGHHLVVVAFSTGHLRIYSLSKQSLIVEIAAHARSISAIDIHPKEPMVVAVSEDAYLTAWSLPTSSSPQTRSLLAQSNHTSIITGVRIVGQHIATTLYDSRILSLYPIPKV